MTNYLLAISALLVVMASLGAWYRGRANLAVVCLMGAAFLVRLLMARLDPFLHDWDERFHAVVARNMLAHPFEPMLRAVPLRAYDYTKWCCNHVWLHKQPLFLWQMALSMKLFGVNEVAMRLPSVLLSSLLIWPVYRLGCLVFQDPLTGYLGALLVTFAYYQLEMVSGAQGMDHNDVAFLAYVTASIWAYYEYRASPHPWRWLVAVGLLAGAAMLCKWLTGLLVYAGWGFDSLLRLRERRTVPEMGRLFASLAIAVAVLLPWQLFTAWRYPLESAYERTYNARHFTEVLEGQGHPWFYHFAMLPVHYGWPLVGLIALGIGLALRRATARATLPVLAMIALIYLLFTLAATKMYSYTYVVSPLLLLLAALALATLARAGAARLAGWRGVVWLLAGTGLAAVLTLDLRPWGIAAFHVYGQAYGALDALPTRQVRQANAAVYRRLAAEVPAGYVIFNVPYNGELEAMFYSGHPVYPSVPDAAEVRQLRAQGVGIATYPAREQPSLPLYLQQPGIVHLWGRLQ